MMTHIPTPRRTSNQKVQGEFYPLQKEELIALRKAKLINNAAYVHLALRFENPYCDRPIEIILKEFALRWQIPESSVYEAIAKLKQLEILKIKIGKVVVEWTYSQQGEREDEFFTASQQDESIDSQQEGDSGNPEFLRDPRKNSEIPEKILRSQKNLRDPRKNSEISENQPPESFSGKDSGSLQTLQTYTDFKKTLSESERENFLNFVKEQIKNLPKQVNDIEAWLANQNQAGQNRWEVYYNNFLADQPQLKPGSSVPQSDKTLKIFELAAQCRIKHTKELEEQRIAAERAHETQSSETVGYPSPVKKKLAELLDKRKKPPVKKPSESEDFKQWKQEIEQKERRRIEEFWRKVEGGQKP